MVLRIAHRGASKYKLENFKNAFVKAIELGIEVVEFDVQFAKDNEIIIMHDDDIKRTTNSKGLVKDLTLKELKKVRNSNDEQILTLEDGIDILKNKCICKIDIKKKGMEDAVIRQIKKNNIEESTIITSGTPHIVKKIKDLCPKIKTEMGGFSKGESAEQIINLAKKVNADIIGVHTDMITERLVNDAHSNNLEVHAWPAEDKKTIKKLKDMNVDGITSSCPDLI